MKKYKVIIPHSIKINKKWLLDNLGGPVYDFELNVYGRCIYSGSDWSITETIDYLYLDWITIGEFENKEHAMLFELSWI